MQQALERYSARQLRLGFLLQQWNSKMDFKESAMAEAKGLESSFNVRPCVHSGTLFLAQI